ncbi:MAG: glycosyltransferase family 4 protein [archaeon]
MDRKRAKRIFLIYEFLSEQGGLEREIIAHANFLKEEGNEVKVLTCYCDKKILKLLPFEGIKIEEISIIKTKIEWLDMALCFLGINKLKKYNPELFLSYSAPSNFLIRQFKNKKINYMNHYPHFLYLNTKEKFEWAKSTQGFKRKIIIFLSFFFGNWMKKIDNILVHKNLLIFTNSDYTRRRMDKLYDIKSKISYPPLDPKFSPSKNVINKKFLFCSSRLIPDKKIEWAIDAVSLMEKRFPIYFAGTIVKAYKEKLEKLGNKKNVEIKFLGRLNTDEIINYYSSAEVFIFPTPLEDFGLVPVESLSCGTPCIVWGDNAGPTEQIIDGINGFYATPYDLKDFARKIDEAITKEFKRKNRQEIIESARKFSAKEIKKSFIKEINNIL